MSKRRIALERAEDYGPHLEPDPAVKVNVSTQIICESEFNPGNKD